MSVTSVNDTTFEAEVLHSKTAVIVDFWAEWCGPCRQIAPTLEDIASEYDGKVKVVKVNVDENPDVPAKYGIRSIPTLMFFKDGQVEATSVGAQSKAKLIESFKLDTL